MFTHREAAIDWQGECKVISPLVKETIFVRLSLSNGWWYGCCVLAMQVEVSLCNGLPSYPPNCYHRCSGSWSVLRLTHNRSSLSIYGKWMDHWRWNRSWDHCWTFRMVIIWTQVSWSTISSGSPMWILEKRFGPLLSYQYCTLGVVQTAIACMPFGISGPTSPISPDDSFHPP